MSTAKNTEVNWKYPCPLCSFVSGFKNSIRRHLAGVHPDVNIGPGEKGQRLAAVTKDLSAEKGKEKPVKLYGCAICLSRYLYRYELNHHYKNEHDLHASNGIEENCLMKEHNSQFSLFKDSQKWELKSGRKVENVLHDFALTSTSEHAAHSFTLNPLDSTWLQLDIFTKEELDEISTYKCHSLPSLPTDLKEFLKEFKLNDQQKIREALWKKRDFDLPFDQKASFDKDWVRNVVYNILLEIECCQLSQDHLESWYMSRIWSDFDRCFANVDDINVIRGESSSIASGVRKNENRLSASTNTMKRQIMGHRADFLIRKLKVEYACGESGKSFTSESDTKVLLERNLKLPKMMKDQLVQLCKLCENDEDTTRKLAIAEILQFGLHTTMMVMDCPAGYVCRILPTPIYKIPTSIRTFPSLLDVIQMVWKAKELIRRIINQVESYNTGNSEELADIDVISSKYRTPSPPTSHKQRLYIPSCVSSPQKRKRCES